MGWSDRALVDGLDEILGYWSDGVLEDGLVRQGRRKPDEGYGLQCRGRDNTSGDGVHCQQANSFIGTMIFSKRTNE